MTVYSLFSLPATLTPGATKKLIEKRNDAFVIAINEFVIHNCLGLFVNTPSISSLLQAIPEGEDPVALVQGAAREHIPIDPANKKSLEAVRVASQSAPKAVPDPGHRPSIEAITVEMQMQEWYAGQMRYTRVFEAREAHIGVYTRRTGIFI